MSQGALAGAIGEDPDMADAHEAARQDVQQEATQAFVDRQGHDLAPVLVGVVLPVEADHAVGAADEPVVGQRDAMRIAPFA